MAAQPPPPTPPPAAVLPKPRLQLQLSLGDRLDEESQSETPPASVPSSPAPPRPPQGRQPSVSRLRFVAGSAAAVPSSPVQLEHVAAGVGYEELLAQRQAEIAADPLRELLLVPEDDLQVVRLRGAGGDGELRPRSGGEGGLAGLETGGWPIGSESELMERTKTAPPLGKRSRAGQCGCGRANTVGDVGGA